MDVVVGGNGERRKKGKKIEFQMVPFSIIHIVGRSGGWSVRYFFYKLIKRNGHENYNSIVVSGVR